MHLMLMKLTPGIQSIPDFMGKVVVTHIMGPQRGCSISLRTELFRRKSWLTYEIGNKKF